MQSKHNAALVPLAKQLRKNMTKEERRLWYDYLRGHPARFTRQKIIGKYIVDFYSAKAALAIELDGSHHYDPEEMKKDNERTAFLNDYGIKVIRIPNNEVMSNLSGVCDFIDEEVNNRMGQLR